MQGAGSKVRVFAKAADCVRICVRSRSSFLPHCGKSDYPLQTGGQFSSAGASDEPSPNHTSAHQVVLHQEAAKHSLEIIDLHLLSHLFQTFGQTVGDGHLDAEIHGVVRALMRRVHRAADEEIDIRPLFKQQLADP